MEKRSGDDKLQASTSSQWANQAEALLLLVMKWAINSNSREARRALAKNLAKVMVSPPQPIPLNTSYGRPSSGPVFLVWPWISSPAFPLVCRVSIQKFLCFGLRGAFWRPSEPPKYLPGAGKSGLWPSWRSISPCWATPLWSRSPRAVLPCVPSPISPTLCMIYHAAQELCPECLLGMMGTLMGHGYA